MGKVRRSGRIAKEIRILLLGMDCNGAVFSEETQTVTLSRHGAGIISKHKLATDGLLIMRFLGGSTGSQLLESLDIERPAIDADAVGKAVAGD